MKGKAQWYSVGFFFCIEFIFEENGVVIHSNWIIIKYIKQLIAQLTLHGKASTEKTIGKILDF